ncbi:hypothetical protein [Enterococcus casseliflavus]|uniref:hypothetical protein n=1 Tax=Enterococcus casseliflavus TaxID=37734 RepID=UPI00232AC862|nr:hypothetical protein [Enterococcus casseliflavus]MDB1688220.1 hypothetical protein [Enterococcus casseliflavus]
MKNKKNEIDELQRQMADIMEKMGDLANAYRNLNLQQKKLKTELMIKVTNNNYTQHKELIKCKNSYDIISLNVASFLKEQRIPIKAKEIHRFLTEEKNHTISYKNLQNNYLPRMNRDSKVNVERAYRGFWQYRNQLGVRNQEY